MLVMVFYVPYQRLRNNVVAMMARPVAGVRRKSVIITLPGSPKGAKENLQAILRFLPHACSQAEGVDSRALHAGGIKKLERDAGLFSGDAITYRAEGACLHTHRGSSDGKGERKEGGDIHIAVSRRYRSSPYDMVSVKDALDAISNQTPDPIVERVPVNERLVGSVLAENVKAMESVPAFRASIVDGYAVSIAFIGQNQSSDINSNISALMNHRLTRALACRTCKWKFYKGQISYYYSVSRKS